jgi:hypothetical protein
VTETIAKEDRPRRMRYIAFLANVDESITTLTVPGAEIRAMSRSEAEQLLTELVPNPDDFLFCRSYSNRIFHHESDRCFVVERRYTTDPHSPALVELLCWQRDTLDPWVQKLRLYQEGNIAIPLEFDFYEDPVEFCGQTEGQLHANDGPCVIAPHESGPIQAFLQETEIPLPDRTLELARKYYEISYETSERSMRFISVMTGMEVLFNSGRDQIRYTMSRYAAVLNGRDLPESQRIFDEMKRLYNLRSEVIHQGGSKTMSDDDVVKLREILRQSIKRLLKAKMGKPEYCARLDSRGFGEGL